MPYRVHREIYDRHLRDVRAGAQIVLAWWLAYVAAQVLSGIAGRVWIAAETLPELKAGLALWAASDGFTILPATLAYFMVRSIQRRADVLAAGPPAIALYHATPGDAAPSGTEASRPTPPLDVEPSPAPPPS
jgi:hypothetical protein